MTRALAALIGAMMLPAADTSLIARAEPPATPMIMAGPIPAGQVTIEQIADVVAKVTPAVVRIVVVRPSKADENPTKVTSASGFARTTSSIGSGFIIDPSGYVATNRHVVENASSVFVVTADGTRHQATIVSLPSPTDMALLRIDAGRSLPSLTFGDSDKVRVGDRVIAIGSPFGFDTSVTSGIISAVNRDILESPFDDYFQTDASTNHGNSGGPLLDLAGEVIGMNSVIFAPGAGWVGLSFAIPSNDMRFVFGRLIRNGEIRAGMLPIYTQQVSWMLEQALDAPGMEGALVSALKEGGEAMLDGQVKSGDIILTFNGLKVLDSRDLARKAAQARIGSNAELEIYRGGRHQTVSVTIQAWPETKPAIPRSPQRKLGLELISHRQDDGAKVVRVASVDPAGTAADSGIQKDDTIIAVQQTPVADADEALRLFEAQSAAQHHFAAVLVERAQKRSWLPIALPE